MVGAASGRLRLARIVLLDPEQHYAPPRFTHVSYDPANDPPNLRFPATRKNLGFAFEHQYSAENHDTIVVLAPFCIVVLATAMLPAWWYRLWRGRWLQQQRRALGECVRCGYDLRETP